MIMERFLKGTVSIHCTTEYEATLLFKWLLNKSIVWKTGSPLTSTNWEDYKEDTIYMLTREGDLEFWSTHGRIVPRIRETIKLSNIDPDELSIIELDLPDLIEFKDLINQYAIHCKTEEESILLFELFAKHKVIQPADGNICNENNTAWDVFYKENTTYAVANKLKAYCMDINFARKVGYKIIGLANIKL